MSRQEDSSDDRRPLFVPVGGRGGKESGREERMRVSLASGLASSSRALDPGCMKGEEGR